MEHFLPIGFLVLSITGRSDLPEPLFDTTFRHWTTTTWSRIRREMGAFIFHQSCKRTNAAVIILHWDKLRKHRIHPKHQIREIKILARDAQSKRKYKRNCKFWANNYRTFTRPEVGWKRSKSSMCNFCSPKCLSASALFRPVTLQGLTV